MRIIRWIFLIVAVTLTGLIFIDTYITNQAEENLYNNIKKVPVKKAVLLLGTAKYIAKGKKTIFICIV